MALFIGIAWPVTVIAAFVIGLLVYRNNAKLFKKYEEQAKAKGKSLEELVK